MARPGREGIATLRLELSHVQSERGGRSSLDGSRGPVAHEAQIVLFSSKNNRPHRRGGSYPLLSLPMRARTLRICREPANREAGGMGILYERRCSETPQSRRVGSDRWRRGMGKSCSSRSWFRALLPCLAFFHPAISPKSFSRLGMSLSGLLALDAWHEKDVKTDQLGIRP